LSTCLACTKPWVHCPVLQKVNCSNFGHAVFASLTYSFEGKLSFLSCACIYGLLILLFSTASTKLTTHKHTEIFVCFVCLDRLKVPWAFRDNFFVKLYFFLFMFEKTNWFLCSFFSLPHFLLWRQISYLKKNPNTHNQSAHKWTFSAKVLHSEEIRKGEILCLTTEYFPKFPLIPSDHLELKLSSVYSVEKL
jgi:hypothetical protein